MLWTLVVVLIIFWLLGYTVVGLGNVVHVVLVVAVCILLYNLFIGRRVGPPP